jgi:hypothetical protein
VHVPSYDEAPLVYANPSEPVARKEAVTHQEVGYIGMEEHRCDEPPPFPLHDLVWDLPEGSAKTHTAHCCQTNGTAPDHSNSTFKVTAAADAPLNAS